MQLAEEYVTIQSLYRDRRGPGQVGLSRDTARSSAVIQCRGARHSAQGRVRALGDTTAWGLRHDRERARDTAPCATIQCATWSGNGHDTAPVRAMTRPSAALGRSGRAVGVQSGFKVCTCCTQPSFGLSALFQSLFGPLFMNTVHEH